MSLQAYIDDSYRAGGTYILAGPIATSENWEYFSEEWGKLLNSGWGVMNQKNNTPHFKYASMCTTEERRNRIPVFLNTLERYMFGFIATRIDISELERAKLRVITVGVNVDWTEFDPFYMAFRSLIDKFHIIRHQMPDLFGSEPADFIFDKAVQEKRINAMWDNYVANRPDNIRSLYGPKPRFVSDDDYPPLQGADLLAGFARECFEQGNPENFLKLTMVGFNRIAEHKLLRIITEEREDDLVKYLMREVVRQCPPGTIIFDSLQRVLHI